MDNQTERETTAERLFSWRRVRTLIIGSALAIVVGLVVANLFTYFQYGGTMFDRFIDKKENKSPKAGKFAFDKGTKYYIGIIRGEGRTPRRGNVYFIEQAGGNMVDVPRENVEIREPDKVKE